VEVVAALSCEAAISGRKGYYVTTISQMKRPTTHIDMISLGFSSPGDSRLSCVARYLLGSLSGKICKPRRQQRIPEPMNTAKTREYSWYLSGVYSFLEALSPIKPAQYY
jgi:hypothetical protein